MRDRGEGKSNTIDVFRAWLQREHWGFVIQGDAVVTQQDVKQVSG